MSSKRILLGRRILIWIDWRFQTKLGFKIIRNLLTYYGIKVSQIWGWEFGKKVISGTILIKEEKDQEPLF